MPATVAATAVEPAATAAMESTTAVEAATITATDEAVRVSATIAVVPIVTAVAVVTATTVVAMAVIAATVEAVAIITAVEPRAGADEDAAGEVVRPVIPIWGAGVRVIAVVTVGADRRWADGAVDGTYSNGHANLRVRAARSGKKQNSQQCNIF